MREKRKENQKEIKKKTLTKFTNNILCKTYSSWHEKLDVLHILKNMVCKIKRNIPFDSVYRLHKKTLKLTF